MFIALLFSTLPLVYGHGGMLWPPSWQDGDPVPLNKITTIEVFSDPVVMDPISGKGIRNIKSWLTDQAYLGGHGEEFEGVGEVTNPEVKEKSKSAVRKTPWASPGRAPSLGGGCGIHGGNPYGCPAGNDSRPAGSPCGQYTPKRGTYAFGSSALDVDFPQAVTTEWKLGSIQEVGWVTKGGHSGGYTYRLCKLPKNGKKELTEECFAQNILKFAKPFTMMRLIEVRGNWTKIMQKDLTEGTYPEGSAWRHVAKRVSTGGGLLRKDFVHVPDDLTVGDYVISLRWDGKDPQVWVSCGYVKLVNKE